MPEAPLWLFFIHKTELPLINETAINYFFFLNETLASAKAAATSSTVKVRSAWRKHRGPGNEITDTQKEKMHGNKLQEILKNQRKHKRMRKVEGGHQGNKKGHEGKHGMIWKVNGRRKVMQESESCNTEKNNMILWKR